jgi:hypothetical protein
LYYFILFFSFLQNFVPPPQTAQTQNKSNNTNASNLNDYVDVVALMSKPPPKSYGDVGEISKK